MGGEPEWDGDLAHYREVLQEIVCPMAENCGNYCEEGEEDGGPVGDVGEEEVVDMDTSLGGKNKIQQKYQRKDSECKGWFEW